MGRGLWFVAGAGAGVYAMVKVRRTAEALTPDGLRDRLAGVGLGAHLFREEVRAGRVEKETELRRRFGLALDGTPQLEAPRRPTTDRPTTDRPEPALPAGGSGSHDFLEGTRR